MRKHSIDSDVSILIKHCKHFAWKYESTYVTNADIRENSARSDASA